jgi:biotin carboxylase
LRPPGPASLAIRKTEKLVGGTSTFYVGRNTARRRGGHDDAEQEGRLVPRLRFRCRTSDGSLTMCSATVSLHDDSSAICNLLKWIPSVLRESSEIAASFPRASQTPNQHAPSAEDRRFTGYQDTAALILASGWRLQYRTLRCAARCFDRVYVLGTKAARPVARSRYCRSFHRLPAEQGFDVAKLPFINRLCEQLNVDWVIPSDGHTTRFLAAAGAGVAPKCYPVPDAATFDLVNDKGSFLNLCQKLGVPTPRTEVLSGRQQLIDRLRGGHLTLPLVAKPTNMEGGHGVVVLHPGKEIGLASGIEYEPIMAQEYIDGRDLCAFYFCREGRIELEALYHHGGHFIEFIEHHGITRQCRKIIEATNYSGVIGFDVRQSSRGDFFFLECNPRFWYNMELAMLAGSNFVEAGIRNTKRPSDVSLAGKVMIRTMGLLKRFPAGHASARLTALDYFLDDLPMMVSFGINKAFRTVRAAAGVAPRLAALAPAAWSTSLPQPLRAVIDSAVVCGG